MVRGEVIYSVEQDYQVVKTCTMNLLKKTVRVGIFVFVFVTRNGSNQQYIYTHKTYSLYCFMPQISQPQHINKKAQFRIKMGSLKLPRRKC